MSFLDEIKNKRKYLRASETIITFPDGRKFIETKSNDLKEIKKNEYGFVIDTKPDLIPAEIIEKNECKLYLGSQDSVNYDNINYLNLTHILSIGISMPDIGVHLKLINNEYIECLDLPETNLLPILLKSNIFIKSCFSIKGNNLLIHCNAGVSRSSAITIGYLILENNFDFNSAYNLVKNKRNCIQPNIGFLKQLKEL